MDPLGNLLVAIAIGIGLVGIVVAAIPGLILIWAAIMVWALVEQTPVAWFIFGLATIKWITRNSSSGNSKTIRLPSRARPTTGSPCGVEYGGS
jgi:uncharacterized protein YqgC (DUF456 family)